MCTVILRDGYWASIASPLFVMLLILKGSGVPLQEKQVSLELGIAHHQALENVLPTHVVDVCNAAQAKERWGNDASYHAWRRRTNLLFPIPPALK